MSRAPSGLEPLTGVLDDVRDERRPEDLITGPHTDLYLRSDFIMLCIGNTVKTEEIQFFVFQENETFWEKKSLNHQLPNIMIHTHTKLTPLDFINKK